MKFKTLFSLNKLNQILRTVRQTFPVTVSVLLVGFFIVTLLIHGSDFQDNIDFWVSSLLTSLFAALLFGTIEYYCSLTKMKKMRIPLLVFGLLASTLFYFGLPTFEVEPRFEFVAALALLFTTLLVSFFSLSAYVAKEKNVQSLSMIAGNLLAVLQGGIVAFLTMIFAFIVFGTLDLLFGINIPAEWYGQWAVFSWMILFPIFFLAQIISIKEFDISEKKFFVLLTRFIFIPFVLFYALVLVAYSAKTLLVVREWPNGVFPWLILGFCISGLFTYLCAQYIEKNRFSHFFTYGLTMNRYFILALGVWLAIVSIFFIVKKGRKLYKVPFSLVMISLVMMIGPWSIFELPENSQEDRMIEVLSRITTFENEIPVPLTDDQVEAYRSTVPELRSIMNYLCDYHGCPLISDWTKTLDLDVNTVYRGSQDEYALLQYLNIGNIYGSLGSETRREYFYYSNFIENISFDVESSSSISFVRDGADSDLSINSNGKILYKNNDITNLLPEDITTRATRFGSGEFEEMISLNVSESTVLKIYNISGYVDQGNVSFTDVSAIVLESK